MKYRLIGVATAVAALLVACAASALAADNPSRRVHQHLEARQPGQECACDGSALCTHLPLVLIDTGGKAIPGDPIRDENQQEIGFTTTEDGEEMLNARIAVVDNAEANNHPGDAAALDTAALIRIRGNSSRYFDKKSYLLRFVDGQGAYADQAVMGMDAHYEWALYGPYLDKSLLRNYMWYNIAGEIMDYAPNVRFCEVMVDGEYRGLYVMLETITSGKNCRLNLTEPIKGSDKTGFLLRLDRGSTTELKNIETFTDSNLNHTGIYLYSKGKIMIHLTFDYKTDEKCTTPGQYLKYHRTFQGLSTRELAEKVGIVPATLVLYENDRHPIKHSTAVALANALGIDRNRLLDKYTAFVDYPYSSLLKKVRQDLSLTQIQMAELIGIGQTSYSGWEREIRVPRRKEYDKILAALEKLRVNVDTYLCQSASI